MKMAAAALLFLLAAAGMFLFLLASPPLAPSLGLPMILVGIAAIILFSWAGLFQRSIITYAVFSTIIQAAYFVLDVGSALAGGKSVWFAFLQALNFTVAGGLFMLVMLLVYGAVRKDDLVEYAGLNQKNNFLVLALCVGCLSLGGMAGFNIFVGEFLLYSFLFAMHPALAIAAIFAGLVCFLFYFRICYTVLVRKSGVEVPLPLPLKAAAGALALAAVLMGVVPHILLAVLRMVS